MTQKQKAKAWDNLVSRVKYLQQFAGNRQFMEKTESMIEEAEKQAKGE